MGEGYGSRQAAGRGHAGRDKLDPYRKVEGAKSLSTIESDLLEWSSVVTATYNVNLRVTLPGLTASGVVAFTDGACIKNPGGPAGGARCCGRLSILWMVRCVSQHPAMRAMGISLWQRRLRITGRR